MVETVSLVPNDEAAEEWSGAQRRTGGAAVR